MCEYHANSPTPPGSDRPTLQQEHPQSMSGFYTKDSTYSLGYVNMIFSMIFSNISYFWKIRGYLKKTYENEKNVTQFLYILFIQCFIFQNGN